jgi:hypothetical protein
MWLQGGEGYVKCVWDRRRHLGSDLDISKEAKAGVRRCLVEFMRAVLRARSKKSFFSERRTVRGEGTSYLYFRMVWRNAVSNETKRRP